MKELVIKIRWGGLGDHLFHTSIPRLAKQQGYDKVYISNHSDYKQSDIKEFIWGNNPFIDGFSDEDRPFPQFGVVEEGMNILDKLVLWWGLEDDGIRFREPEIFYIPQIIPELKDAIIFDPNFGTARGHPSGRLSENFFVQKKIIITHQMKPLFKMTALRNKPSLNMGSLEYLSDVIFSCKQMFCLTTGTATLAAALGKPVTILYTGEVLPMFHHSKLHIYKELK